MPALYSHTSRSDGTVLTATIYNSSHQNHIDNGIPAQLDDFSSSVSQMQQTVDPGEVGTESLPTTLAGELERLRFAIGECKTAIGLTAAKWHVTPTGAITAGFGGVPSGATFDYVGSTAPTGYVLLDGKTIGNAASGGTERANADTETLFTLLWNSMADAEAPVSGGRGASAAADFAANKTITLPDKRGRASFGKDDMGGAAASRITSAGSGITGTTLGTSGGAQNVTITTSQLPASGLSVPGLSIPGLSIPSLGVIVRDTGGGSSQGITANADTNTTITLAAKTGTGTTGTGTTGGGTTGNMGTGGALNKMPGALILNVICKL